MKVLIATGIFPPDIGGPATYSKRIVEELTKHGHEVTVTTYCDTSNFQFSPTESRVLDKVGTITNFQLNPNDQNSNNQNGAPCHSRESGNPEISRAPRQLPVVLRYFVYFLKVLWCGRNVDLIYLQDPVSAGLPTTLANLFLGKRLVLKIVGDYAWEQYQQYNNITIKQFIPLDEFYSFEAKNYSYKIRLFQKIQTWVAGRADRIITPSGYLKGIVQKWGIPENKIDVVYNAFPKSEFRIPNPENKDDKYFTIISVGRLVPWKGYNGLIEAFAELPEAYPHLKFKIIGGGPMFEDLRFKIKDLRIEDKVELVGSLSHEETLREMAKASLFVLNTAYEGLSHVILESLAVGTPVVTTTAGGNPEVIKDRWNGILIKYNDSEALKSALIKMIEDKDFREKCVKNGLESLKKFSEEGMIEQTLNILEIKN